VAAGGLVVSQPVGAAQPGWTVLVYVAADNNLEAFAIPNLQQMASVGSGPGLDIEVFIDRSAKYSNAPLGNLGDFTGAKVLQVGAGSFTEVENLGQVDSGDPGTLSGFITRAAQRHPSDKLAVIIWDHGSGWLGTALDEQTNHIISLAKLQQALQAGLAGAGKAKYEMLGFDSCLMSNTAVLGTLAPMANWITGSAELEPGHGWDYSALSSIEGGNGSGLDLGRAVADAFMRYATSQNTNAGATLTVVEGAKVPAMMDAVNAAGNALTGSAANVAPAFSSTRANILSYGKNPDPAVDFHLVDLGVLASSTTGSAPQMAAVSSTLQAAVAYKVVGPGIAQSSGVSLYYPPAQDTYRKSYGNVPVVAGWNRFLGAYYTAGESRAAASPVTFEDEEPTAAASADYDFTEQGVFLTVPFEVAEAETISDVRIRYGLVDADGSPVLIGEDPGAFARSGAGIAGGAWDLSALKVSDGLVSSEVYRKITVDPEANTLTFTAPFAYYPDGIDQPTVLTVFGNAVVDLATGKAQRTYYELKQDPTEVVADTDDAGVTAATSGFLLDPNGILVPIVARLGADGEVQFVKVSDTSIAGGAQLRADPTALKFRVAPIESGTEIYSDLAITQVGGSTTTASMTDVVP
jgi:Clostripain family